MALQHYGGKMMTAKEIEALRLCKEDLIHGIDAVHVAEQLQMRNLLPSWVQSRIREMIQSGYGKVEICEQLVSQLPFHVSILDLVSILDNFGYSRVASKLFLTLLKLNETITFVSKTNAGQRPTVHRFFTSLKQMVHDAQFENPRLALRQLAERFAVKLEAEDDPVKKQILADKSVAIIGAEIDAHAITFDNELTQKDIFTEMKNLIPKTSNTLTTDVIYYGRLANAFSIVGNFEDGEKFLTMARCCAYSLGPSLEIVNMLYIIVYVKLWQFEKYPTPEIRESLMVWGRKGLESLEEEQPETKTLWRRMFILRMVFCLLGVGNRANIIEDCPIDEDCLQEARNLLADIDRNFYGIETRRKMFYYVARGRLSELTGELVDSLGHLNTAKKLAKEGEFKELKFISEHHENVLGQLRWSTQAMGSDSQPTGFSTPVTGSDVLLHSRDKIHPLPRSDDFEVEICSNHPCNVSSSPSVAWDNSSHDLECSLIEDLHNTQEHTVASCLKMKTLHKVNEDLPIQSEQNGDQRSEQHMTDVMSETDQKLQLLESVNDDIETEPKQELTKDNNERKGDLSETDVKEVMQRFMFSKEKSVSPKSETGLKGVRTETSSTDRIPMSDFQTLHSNTMDDTNSETDTKFVATSADYSTLSNDTRSSRICIPDVKSLNIDSLNTQETNSEESGAKTRDSSGRILLQDAEPLLVNSFDSQTVDNTMSGSDITSKLSFPEGKPLQFDSMFSQQITDRSSNRTEKVSDKDSEAEVEKEQNRETNDRIPTPTFAPLHSASVETGEVITELVYESNEMSEGDIPQAESEAKSSHNGIHIPEYEPLTFDSEDFGSNNVTDATNLATTDFSEGRK